MIEITPDISIDESEINWDFIRSSGPGGQNVNKTATAVQLRFNVLGSKSLPEHVRLRLIKEVGRRITTKGVLIIEAKRYRSQKRNREDALQRLIDLIKSAAQPRKPRKKIKHRWRGKERRLEQKRRIGDKKRSRRPIHPEDY